MKAQRTNSSAAPEAMFVSTLSEIIAPIAHAVASAVSAAVDYAITWHTRRREDRAVKGLAGPAPHVALVMVPGQFVTAPFMRR